MKIRYLANPLGMLAGIAILIEGLVVVAYAAPTTIDGIGGIMEQTVILGGAQLFVLGLLLVLAWMLKDSGISIRGRKIFGPRMIRAIAVLLGAIVAVEGVVIALSVGRTFIEGIGAVMEQTMVLAGAQLFGLGALASATWVLREDPSLRTKIARLVSVTLGIVIAAEGVLVMGLSGPSIVNGIGGITGQTVLIVGAQLFIVGMLVAVAWVLKDRGVFRRNLLYWSSLPDFLIFIFGIVIAFEGVAVMSLAAGTYVQSIGLMLGQTILIGGIQLFGLGFLQILMLAFPKLAKEEARPRVAVLGMLFLILMIPVAFVL